MTTTINRTSHPPDGAALSGTEARRVVRSPIVWIGIAVSVYVWVNRSADFSAGAFQLTSAAFAAVAAATFVLAVNVASRDRILDAGPLCLESVLDADLRARARLLAMWPAFAVAVSFIAVMFGIERIEGGDWIGDRPGPVSDVVHGPAEMVQPVLLILLAVTAGIALGRITRHRIVVSLVGVLVFSLVGMLSWAWQWRPAVFVTLVQTQPIEVELGPIRPTEIPATGWLSAPDAYDRTWGHVIVHDAMAAWHDVYLLGLALVFAGFAVRRRAGRVLVPLGVVLVIAGVVAQLIVAPANFG